jgi:hypothetical protein
MELPSAGRLTLSSRTIPASLPLLATLASALAIAGCAAPRSPAAQSIDGYAIGASRSVSPDEFHRLEATARDAVNGRWPGMPLTGIQLVSAGTLEDGSVQVGTEGPFTFLVVIDVHGEGRHALVLQCDDATFPQAGSCTSSR